MPRGSGPLRGTRFQRAGGRSRAGGRPPVTSWAPLPSAHALRRLVKCGANLAGLAARVRTLTAMQLHEPGLPGYPAERSSTPIARGERAGDQ